MKHPHFQMLSVIASISNSPTQHQTTKQQGHHNLFLKHNTRTITTNFKKPDFVHTKLIAEPKSKKSTLVRQVFDEIPRSNAYAWNNLMQTHLSSGDPDIVLVIYCQMLVRGVRPDTHTLPRVLTASRRAGFFGFGKQVHGQAFKLGVGFDDYVVTALIELYGFLDCVGSAKWLFDKVPKKTSVSWTMVARLYLMESKPRLAVDSFYEMVEVGVKLDAVAFITAIGGCGSLRSVKDGRRVEKMARRFDLESDGLVNNALMKMYVDCGRVEDAKRIFDRMPFRDIVSWTVLISGCVKNGAFNEGQKLFRRMIKDGIKPDANAMASVLPSCARTAAHKLGKEIHGFSMRNGVCMNLKLYNTILDMYVKTGYIESASKIFSRMKDRDVVSWTVMILGYSVHGRGELGVDMFRKMVKDSRIDIDQFLYAAVLHACSTARMVDEGNFYFNCIKKPTITHFALRVSLLARAGLFDEARIFIEEHQIGRNAEVLRAVLDGCRIHKQIRFSKQIVEQLCELEPLNAQNYVLLSNWYAHFKKWDLVNRIEGTMKDMGLSPHKAYSWVEFRNKVHVFGTGDVSHPRSEKIYWELTHLLHRIENEGHQPNLDFSLHDVDEERECIQIGHSELLAISFGLISTHRDTIRVTKNQRVCTNCHSFAKVLSKVIGREIILKDPKTFHHFKNGNCSCGDYW